MSRLRVAAVGFIVGFLVAFALVTYLATTDAAESGNYSTISTLN